MPLEREPTSPTCVSALAAYVLKVEVGGPNMLSDVFDVDTMNTVIKREVERAAGVWPSTQTVGPLADNTVRAVLCRVSMGDGEVLAKSRFANGNDRTTGVHLAAHDGRGRNFRN
jgi:hypothetical protein